MSHSNTKSHKQSGAPIIINVKRTQYGYQLTNEKAANTTISLTKSMLAKTGNKSSKNAKDSIPKSMHKSAGPTTPSAAQKNANVSKSKTSSKPSEAGLKTVAPTMTQSVIKERAPPVVLEEIRRREIFPFTDFTGAEGELEIPETNIPADLNISGEVNRLEKVLESVAGQTAHNLKPADKGKKRFPLFIPSSAHWFKLEEIHQLEKEELSEFFEGKPSKTPETYKKYRNHIIDLYRQNPKIYLNSSKCRKSLGGDACAIMRIHHFLERWGIINFSVNPKRQQNLNLARPGRVIDKIFVFSKNEDKFDMFEFEPVQAQRDDENDKIFHQIEALTKKYRPLCESCGMMCGLVWYQQKSPQQYQSLAILPVDPNPNKTPVASDNANANPNPTDPANPTNSANSVNPPATSTAYVIPPPKKSKELILCMKCFTDGNIPSILSHSDFSKISVLSKLNTSVDNVQTAVWTEEDNVQLLELIEKHADDWDEIQKVIPHRSQEETILHYLELPLNNVTSLNIAEAHEDEDEQPDKAKEDLEMISPAFNDYANPILQHVALFKSLLDKFRPNKKKDTEVKDEQERAMNAEIVGVKDEERTNRTMEVEVEEDKKGSKDLVINDAEFDFDKIEQERANYERGRHGHFDELLDHEGGYRLRRREDNRLREATNTMVDLHITKLQDKLDFFDEYEKILWQERRYQEVYQKVLIGERVALAHKRKEFMRQEQPHGEQAYEHRDPTAMLNFNSHHHQSNMNMNVDDMIGNNDKGDEYSKNSFEN